MIRGALLAAVLVLLAPRAAEAAIDSCQVSATGVAFGLFIENDVSAVGSITLVCTGSGNAPFNPYTVSLSPGFSPGYEPRTMRGFRGSLAYNLYQEERHNTVWGDGGGRSRPVTGRLDFRPNPVVTEVLTVYGLIPAQAAPRPGHYVDLIIVTVEF